MHKMKMGVSISMVWASRNVVHSGLLQKLCASFDVCVLLRLPSPELEYACQRMGATTKVLPSVSEKTDHKLYRRVLEFLNNAHKARVGQNSEKYKRGLIRRNLTSFQSIRLKLRDALYVLAGQDIFYHFFTQLERYLYYKNINLTALQSSLFEENLDFILLTAPLQQESLELHLTRACRNLGIPTIAMILGFDNLTTKGRLPEYSGHFLVWNDIMRNEVCRVYPKIDSKNVFVTGSPQFDFYSDSSWGYTREKFCAQLKLDPEAQIVFYSANTDTLVPHEHLLVENLIRRVRLQPDMRNVQFLVRLHPFEHAPTRWQSVKEMPGVVFTSPWRAEDNGTWGFVSKDDIHLLAGSLKHSACNINISSTMALDAVFCDRPVVAPAYDVSSEKELSPHIRNLYEREYYLPITNSGAITLVDSPQMAIDAIRDAINKPAQQHVARLALTKLMLGRPVGHSVDSIMGVIKDITRKGYG